MRASVTSVFHLVLFGIRRKTDLPLLARIYNIVDFKRNQYNSVLIIRVSHFFTQPGKMVWITTEDKVPNFKKEIKLVWLFKYLVSAVLFVV